MIKVLSIGNSFSQDAQRYLHQIAENEGVELQCENLYIGGCSLARHWENIEADAAAYDLEHFGRSTGEHISIKDALLRENWDYITLQQVSHASYKKESFEPYLGQLNAYMRSHIPNAKIFIHQTWAYEQDSERLQSTGFKDAHQMMAQIKETYAWAMNIIHADGLIPSGEAMMAALDSGISKIHRDTFHADLGFGRYLLGCTWYMTLTGRNVSGGAIPLDVESEECNIEIVRKAAWETVSRYLH